MFKSKKAFSTEFKALLKQHKLHWIRWELRQDLPQCVIIRDRVTGEFKMLEKSQNPKRLGN